MRAARARAIARERTAQAAVEMAVTVPVLLALALITFNLMVFASAVARFDRVAPTVVLAHAVSPVTGGEEAVSVEETVERELAQAMEGYDIEVAVEVDHEGDGGSEALALVGGLETYRCILRYTPWPQGLVIAGVALGAPGSLEHVRAVTFDPWRSGVVM